MARYLQTRRMDPFRDLMAAQRDLSRLFDRALSEDAAGLRGAWTPRMDIHEAEDGFRLWMDVPGMTSEQVEVTLDRNLLTVRGERTFTDEHQQEDFHRIERRYGAFERTVTLPSHVEADGITASVADGVLEVFVPKAEEAKPRQIKVGTAKRLQA